MVVYNFEGQRRVAHAAASSVPKMDCKQEFLNTPKSKKATLNGWFKPFVDSRDGARKVQTFGSIAQYIGHNPHKLVTFGVITQNAQAYSLEAFKPDGIPGNDWVVTEVTPHAMSREWKVT